MINDRNYVKSIFNLKKVYMIVQLNRFHDFFLILFDGSCVILIKN